MDGGSREPTEAVKHYPGPQIEPVLQPFAKTPVGRQQQNDPDCNQGGVECLIGVHAAILYHVSEI